MCLSVIAFWMNFKRIRLEGNIVVITYLNTSVTTRGEAYATLEHSSPNSLLGKLQLDQTFIFMFYWFNQEQMELSWREESHYHVS